MDSLNHKSYLELKTNWKDEHLFELNVIVCNSKFYGEIEVYDQFESLAEFAKELEGFPQNNNKILFYETSVKNTMSFFSMKFYQIGKAGHVGVEIYIEEDVASQWKEEEKNKLKIEIIVEPNAIDIFHKQLVHMTKVENGNAILLGIDN